MYIYAVLHGLDTGAPTKSKDVDGTSRITDFASSLEYKELRRRMDENFSFCI